MSQNVIPVSDVNRYIKSLLTQDYYLKNISVSGEVSGISPFRGSLFFTLKDKEAELSCVIWESRMSGLRFPMQEGDSVVVTGALDFYTVRGTLQLSARKIEKQGAGALYEKYLALKQELEEMGMFAPEYKQPIPFYVKRLGIVTAPTGAVIHDIQKVARRRNPYIELILYPSLVQGEQAAANIVRGIQTLDAMGLDCLIVGRGGGSIEDLWAFNEEAVARAIFDCQTPIISAVGHETDTTIADLVADLRAPTPSAAAELAVCNIFEVEESLQDRWLRMRHAWERCLAENREALHTRETRLRLLSPQNQLHEKRQRLAECGRKLDSRLQMRLTETRHQREQLSLRLQTQAQGQLQQNKHRLQLLLQRWEGASPLRKLQQGYAYVADDKGKKVSSVAQVKEQDMLHLEMLDGSIHTRVVQKEPRELWQIEEA